MDAFVDELLFRHYRPPTNRPGLSRALGSNLSLSCFIKRNAEGVGPQTSICARSAVGAAERTSEPPRATRADRKDCSALKVRSTSITSPETKPIPRVAYQAVWPPPSNRNKG